MPAALGRSGKALPPGEGTITAASPEFKSDDFRKRFPRCQRGRRRRELVRKPAAPPRFLFEKRPPMDLTYRTFDRWA
jgi:hypothetical protein